MRSGVVQATNERRLGIKEKKRGILPYAAISAGEFPPRFVGVFGGSGGVIGYHDGAELFGTNAVGGGDGFAGHGHYRGDVISGQALAYDLRTYESCSACDDELHLSFAVLVYAVRLECLNWFDVEVEEI